MLKGGSEDLGLGGPTLLFLFVSRCGNLKFLGTPGVANEDKS